MSKGIDSGTPEGRAPDAAGGLDQSAAAAATNTDSTRIGELEAKLRAAEEKLAGLGSEPTDAALDTDATDQPAQTSGDRVIFGKRSTRRNEYTGEIENLSAFKGAGGMVEDSDED